MTTPNFEQITQQINMITVMHTQFKAAYEGILQLVEQSIMSALPLGGSVVAPPGSGKTHLIKSIERKFTQNTDLIDPSSAVVVISASSSPSSGSMIDRSLQQLGHPPGIRSIKLQDLRQSLLMQAFQDRGVRLLIIDEFQHLFRGRRDIQASEITDLLKEIMDVTDVPIFVFGTDELGDLAHLDEQFASRLPARFQIRPFAKGEEWKGFLQAFHEQSEFINISSLSTLAKQLHYASSGSPRTLKFLINAAVKEALAQGKLTVERCHYGLAFSAVFGPFGALKNPFN